MPETFKVIREHTGDREYRVGEERVANRADVKHLIGKCLAEPDAKKQDAPLSNKTEPRLSNKAKSAAEKKARADADPKAKADAEKKGDADA